MVKRETILRLVNSFKNVILDELFKHADISFVDSDNMIVIKFKDMDDYERVKGWFLNA